MGRRHPDVDDDQIGRVARGPAAAARRRRRPARRSRSPDRSSRLARPSRSRTSSSARTTRKPVMSRRSPFPPEQAASTFLLVVDETIGYEHAASELAVRGGLTRRMVVASGLLALVIATAFAVLLSSVADLRTSERRARQSEEVLVVANRLERLVVDLETGQRGFVITGQAAVPPAVAGRSGRLPWGGQQPGTAGRGQPRAASSGAADDPAALPHISATTRSRWSPRHDKTRRRTKRGRDRRRKAAE